MGNFNVGDKVSAWVVCDPMRHTPSVWKAGTVEGNSGGMFKVRFDDGSSALLCARYVREPLGQDLMPGRIVGADFTGALTAVPEGTQFATVVWVNAYYAQLEVPTNGERLLVSVAIEKIIPMSEVV